MGYRYVLTRLKNPKQVSDPDYHWTQDVVDWALSLEEVKEKLTAIYPSAGDQWEEWKGAKGDTAEPYFWGQVPEGPRLEFTIHLQPFPWLSIQTSDLSEVIKVARVLRLSALDVQAGIWVHIQDG